jgi:RNA polymerase sigma-70 factor (ECF subfamily)
VGAEGFSYEEAAEICGCAVGTIKSRVNRARNRLVDLLGDDELKSGQSSGAAIPNAPPVKHTVRG